MQNGSLEAYSSGDTPDCWERGGFGSNSFTWTKTTDAQEGQFAQKVEITSHSRGARRLVSLRDTGSCGVAVRPGQKLHASAWYHGTGEIRLMAYRHVVSTGKWEWWAETALLPPANSYRRATWFLPTIPTDTDFISSGPSLYSVGSLTVDDISIIDLCDPNIQSCATTVCDSTNSIDLGGELGPTVQNIPADSCVMVTDYPTNWQASMKLEVKTNNGVLFPFDVEITQSNSCDNSGPSNFVIDVGAYSVYSTGANRSNAPCATYFKLHGSSNGILGLNWYYE